jgi:hypothetical protein
MIYKRKCGEIFANEIAFGFPMKNEWLKIVLHLLVVIKGKNWHPSRINNKY